MYLSKQKKIIIAFLVAFLGVAFYCTSNNRQTSLDAPNVKSVKSPELATKKVVTGILTVGVVATVAGIVATAAGLLGNLPDVLCYLASRILSPY